MTVRLFGEVSINGLQMALSDYSRDIRRRAEVSKLNLRYFYLHYAWNGSISRLKYVPV